MVLLLASLTIDFVAYFSKNQSLQSAGFWILAGCVCSCSVSIAAQLRKKAFPHATPVWCRSMLISAAFTGLIVLLAWWRGTSGPALVASFDGSYPVLIAFAFVLASYAGWLEDS